MIEVSSGIISILYTDGTSAAFDPDELRQRLEKSCMAVGMPDPWIAGEIVLAVEYALRCRAGNNDGNGLLIHAADIDDCVSRILEDSGYPVVSTHFRKTTAHSGDFGKLTLDTVKEYLITKLQLAEPGVTVLAEQVRCAMAAIGAEKCSPRLVLELARHFRETAASAQKINPVAKTISLMNPAQKKTDLSIQPEKNTVCTVRCSDTIFPSIRAEINLNLLFENCTLTPPLTELSMTGLFFPVVEKLDWECAKLRNDREFAEFPLILTFRGFKDFARKWLSYHEDEAVIPERRIKAFSDFFCSLLREKPFKIFLW